MTNIKSHPTQAGNKPPNQTAKKADPFASLKSSIMIVSIAGTMGGWLLLLNQETDTTPVNTAMLSAVALEGSESAIEPMPIVDISQLRQVNEVAPVEPIAVVARTRSSR
ncbi:hypothetical protein [Psychrobacter urativorans]|uniref:Uncharacterized protein n=1 Tax=Psychrobacter urativorans TaxID=45610 RepID=A0A0M4T0U0_9GAMM|nr:hypothetical protein [Psychrobacter urativorans]ALF58802.1 hypothetical protein AOC03_01005 [Psychrobacter urativorans]